MKLSVLISVYGKENPLYLQESLKSLLLQTRKADSVVLVEDGEIPLTLINIIADYKIKLNIISVKLRNNSGLAVALNEGLKYCDGELIARMDSDDISLSNRFERQIAFMDKYKDISVSSAFIEEINEFSETISVRKLPITHDEITIFSKMRSPISHPVAIFRKADVISVGGYPLFRKAQDMALWSKMIMKGYKFSNISEVLLRMRICEELNKKRGVEHLKEEIKVLNYQKSIGFIGNAEYTRNLIVRGILRLSPMRIKKIAYKARDLML